MADEHILYRDERLPRYKAAFQMWFTYRLLHKKRRLVTASGHFTCAVNPHSQTIEYRMDLQSEPISRPYSESYSILFSSPYDEIPPQCVSFTQYPILRLKYPVPIYYDWQAFLLDGMKQALQKKKLQALLRDYRVRGVSGQEIDAELKVVEVTMRRADGEPGQGG